ncbi:MAG: hypothetical protein AAF604_16055 [Acidobacteriota bacterium]
MAPRRLLLFGLLSGVLLCLPTPSSATESRATAVSGVADTGVLEDRSPDPPGQDLPPTGQDKDPQDSPQSATAKDDSAPHHSDHDPAAEHGGLPAAHSGEAHASHDQGDAGHGEDESHGAGHGKHGGHSSRLTEERIPLLVENVPQRPKPILELGEPFLGSGTLKPGFHLPTGAVWQPSLLVFGTLRTAVQSFENEVGRVSELTTRLDLFANLQLSGTERLVVGFRPFDRNGRFTNYTFESTVPGVDDGEFTDELNGEITSLFFEGDFGEIFPNLSRNDFSPTDVGFSVGRQPMLFQEGLLINDAIDGLGITRNTLQPKKSSNFRATFFWGWNEVGRPGPAGNREDDQAHLLALLTSADLRRSTIDADLVWVLSDERQTNLGGSPLRTGGDLLAGGLSFVQRIGELNTSFRVLGSLANDETASSSDGFLLFSEISRTPHRTHDLLYVNGFVALDRYTSAARGPAAGGPLGRAGINFAAVGLGRYGAALSSQAEDVVGGAVGYQRFFDHTRKQLIVELGARLGTSSDIADAVAATARYQAALMRRFVLRTEVFAGLRRDPGPAGDDEELFGGRFEVILKF